MPPSKLQLQPMIGLTPLKKYTYIGLCIFTIIVLVILLALFRCNSVGNTFNALNANKSKQINNFMNKPYTNYHAAALEHPTKSVDGESQFTPNSKWKAQPSKCFDCEAQLQAQCGDACVYNTTKQKVFNN